jgi:heme oxygenase
MHTVYNSSILEQLRTQTRPQHEALEEVARSEKLGNGELNPKEYHGLLTANYWAHRYLEEALENNFAVASFLPDWPERKKVNLLIEELKKIGKDPEAVWKNAPLAKAPQLQTEAQAWGTLYVMEGSTLGGAVIAKSLQKNNDLTTYMPPVFYGSYGKQTGALWKEFRSKLEAAFTNPEAEQEAVKAAAQTFDFYADCFSKAMSGV